MGLPQFPQWLGLHCLERHREAGRSVSGCVRRWTCPGPHFYVTNNTRRAFLLVIASLELPPLLGAWCTDSRNNACLRKPPSQGKDPDCRPSSRLLALAVGPPAGYSSRPAPAPGDTACGKSSVGCAETGQREPALNSWLFFFFFNMILVISRCF